MPSNTKEIALEATLEQHLLTQHGYQAGQPADFDKEFALDTARFWYFLESTQPRELAKLQRHADYRRRILHRYHNLAKKHGVLHLLRRGLRVEDATFELLYQLPGSAGGERARRRFAANEWSVTRQLRYHRQKTGEEIDVVVFVNGIPLATIELKNAWTGQTARVQGRKQYERDRDPGEPLLQFGRCLVHLAVDTDEVWMTTRLNGSKTFFLPFNKGNEHHGAGNSVNPAGHKTAYLWEDVLSPASLAALVQHFVTYELPEDYRGKPPASVPLGKKTLIFPRYHQRDVVRKLLADVTTHGAGRTYLIQHSAGSGKSNSITWLAYQLIEVQRAGAAGPLFDTVIVVTDRRLLDQQIRDNIKQFSQVGGVVAWAKSSADLRAAMEGGKRIVVTTVQKFPFVVDEIQDLSHRTFAVIIDEAHGSQSGTTAGKMNEALGGTSMLASDVAPTYHSGADAGAVVGDEEQSEEDADVPTAEDRVNAAMAARKMKDNAAYFAFTATPKNTTLERFGTRQADGSFRPFHLYSMRQAIEEGFILDVLTNYTTYRSYYEIEKSVAENPLFDTAKAQARLKAFVERDPRTIASKAEVILDHFLHQVVRPKKLKGKAKAMVVTQSIPSAIRYYLALRRKLAELGNPFRILIAFSGEKLVDGHTYIEAILNGFPDGDTRDRFDEDDHRILVVANKYLTGFDQRKLTAMYVDKRLQGVLAVQALSRLNRANQKLGKRPEDLFVLDFFNTAEEIKLAFDPYYTTISLERPTDIGVLHDLMDALEGYGLYDWSEVIHFTNEYFAGVEAETLSPLIDTVADRFTNGDLTDEMKADFKIKAKQFVKIYAQMAAIIDFDVLQWEQLFWFLKFLVPKLRLANPHEGLADILESVDLSSYGLQRTRLNQPIALDGVETSVDPQSHNMRGVHGESEEEELDLIIRSFNERYYADWPATPEEQRIKILNLSKAMVAHKDYAAKVKDNPDVQTSELAIQKIFKDVMAQQRRNDLELYRLAAKDAAFADSLLGVMRRMVGRGGA